ncbi:hypothetical protein AsAng_0052630 [Aureispira anguillae]|uniref:Uncharacterized protein n=1 Tax=Aureispira anguillae TaxID=2864201 RepID=A0A915YJY9_9BACT|nr:hypothetical protein AsAng_0052630 [Aureispira anguillae]
MKKNKKHKNLHTKKKRLIFVSMEQQTNISFSLQQSSNSLVAWWWTTSLRWRE